jgi:hypothetical protein
MWYPEPTQEVLNFLKRWYEDEHAIRNESFQYEPIVCDLFSWAEHPDDLLTSYLSHITSYARLRRSLPFITHIYLANSITFNALHEKSDIDLLILVKPGRMWLARIGSWLLLWIFWLLRIGNRSVKKFCLSFTIEQKHENLYEILLQPTDIYMIFRLAHLVPLYAVHAKDVDLIRKSNKRLKGYLPNHPGKQLIRLGNELVVGNNTFKDVVEYLFGGMFGNFCNKIVWLIRSPLLYYKKSRLSKKGRWIVISDTMLKFHGDKRKEIMLRYMNATKSWKG